MNLYKQAVTYARRLLAAGKVGTELAGELRDLVGALSPQQRRRLAARIDRDYLILGHAAHDPNLYSDCQTAKQAKESSRDPHLKLVTYETPVCASCTFNRKGTCGLMGGRLVAGPRSIPEVVVQRTADLLTATGAVSARVGARVAAARQPADVRLVRLHAQRLAHSVARERDQVADARGQAQTRRVQAMLDPADQGVKLVPKGLTGPRRVRNGEALGLGVTVVRSRHDRSAAVQATGMEAVFDRGGMEVELPVDVRAGRQAGCELDSYTETDVPDRAATRNQARVSTEGGITAQRGLERALRQASRLLAAGQISTQRAARFQEVCEQFLVTGAQHTRRTAAIQRQLEMLSGGLEL